MTNEIGTSNSDGLAETVDLTTRARVGSLAARGLGDTQIADVLLLSVEQVQAVRTTQEFKEKYAQEADRAIQDQIDRDEGWDAVESQALEVLLTTMKFNRDPKFALVAAKTANAAERRARNSAPTKTIGDAPANGGEKGNIVFIQINKNYAERNEKQIDITPRPDQIPLKQSDTPAPKLVDQILSAAKEKAGLASPNKNMDDIKELFKQSGVVFDGDE